MTKKEAVVARLGDDNKIDYALPQRLVDRIAVKLGVPQSEVVQHFVYSYKHDAIFGELQPITDEGDKLLARYLED